MKVYAITLALLFFPMTQMFGSVAEKLAKNSAKIESIRKNIALGTCDSKHPSRSCDSDCASCTSCSTSFCATSCAGM